MYKFEFNNYHQASSAQPFHLTLEASIQSEDWPAEWSEIHTKEYPRLPLIRLPRTSAPEMPLGTALARRTSCRFPSDETDIDSYRLATLLEHSIGPQQKQTDDDLARRRYPSAGARFPTEAYLLVSRCDDIAPGVYHYSITEHGLRLLRNDPYVENVKTQILNNEWASTARIWIVLTAVMWRGYDKYGERAYRYALLEAGHVMQNLCLTAAAIGLGITPVGGFADVALWELLDVGDDQELPSYIAVIPLQHI